MGLNKVLPLLLLPVVVVILFLLAGLRWKRVLMTMLAIGTLGIFGVPVFANLLMRTLEDLYPYRSVGDCPRSDAVFVFGGMIGVRDRADGGVAWNQAAERFDRAVQLVKGGKATFLVLSGGEQRYPGVGDEGELLEKEAITRGVSQEMILITEPTENTLEEANALCRLVASHHWTRVLVVTSAFHMPRAIRLCRTCARALVAVPVAFETPSPYTNWAYRRPEYYIPQAAALARSELAMREYMGIIVNLF